MNTNPPQAVRGFTLIEVLVALGIVAVALAAGLQAAGALRLQAERQADNLLAQLCAENALGRLRLARQMPGVGETRLPCEQAQRTLEVRLQVQSTPNPSFVRVDAQVTEAGVALGGLSTVLGRY